MTTQTRTVRVQQGSQPTFAGVRVGVMRVGEHRGDLKARLVIRDHAHNKRVDLVQGSSEDLFGTGTLTLDQVHLPADGRRGGVTLSFVAADA